jgi:uncharacterized protein
MAATDPATGPLSGAQRVELLDALRGMALLGVLFVNTVWFSTAGTTIEHSQMELLPTARLDRWIELAMQLFVFAKANTIFTLLFGISFAMQMQRLDSRGAAAIGTYARRLSGLLAFGLLHLFGVWKGEILHVYALAGFLLLATWRWRTGTLVVAGLILVLVIHPLMLHADTLQRALALGAGSSAGAAAASDAAQLHALAFRTGNYIAVLRAQWDMLQASGYLFAGLVAWIVYALGRFMLGVAIARSGVLLNPEPHRSMFATTLAFALPAGLALTAGRWLMQIGQARGWWSADANQWRTLTDFMQQFGTLLLALSYIAGAAWCWTILRLRRLLVLCAPVGRMALTNYLLQSAANMVLFFGFGLGLIGRVGMALCLALSIGLFAVQMAFSHLWLRTHPYGPVEWLWRWWTYRRRPAWGHR